MITSKNSYAMNLAFKNNNLTDDKKYKGTAKAYIISTYICYSLIAICFIWAFITVLIKSTIYKIFEFWGLLFLGFVFPLLMVGVFLLTFVLYKAFKSHFIHLSVILTHLVLFGLGALIHIRFKFYIGYMISGSILGLLDITLLVLYFTDPLSRLLFSLSIEKLYSVKLILLKYISKRIAKISLAIYFGLFSLGICIISLIEVSKIRNKINNNVDGYLLGTTIAIGTVCYLSLVILCFLETLEPILLGILIFIHKKKEKTNNSLITERDINECFKQLEDIKIKDKFYGSAFFPYDYRYSNKNIINLKESIIFIAKDFIESLEKVGFPLQFFGCTSGYIYSIFYGVSMQEATNMCIPAFYYSGYLTLLNGYGLRFLTGTKNILMSVNITGMVAFIWLIIIFTKIETSTNEWITFGISLEIIILSLLSTIGMVNGLIQGYSNALVCLYIEDPETALADGRYSIRLKKLMKKKAHLDRIK